MDVFEKRMTSETRPIKQSTQFRDGEGKPYWVRELDFEQIEEPWARYKLKDGGEVRQRATTLRIFEVFAKDETTGEFIPLRTPAGDRQIVTEAATQVVHSE